MMMVHDGPPINVWPKNHGKRPTDDMLFHYKLILLKQQFSVRLYKNGLLYNSGDTFLGYFPTIYDYKGGNDLNYGDDDK